MILTVLPGPYSRSTTLDDELSFLQFPCLIVSPWTTNLISSLCRTHGSNNLSLHHSFDLMSSPTDYIFMKSLDKCVVIIINLISSSRISTEFMMRNTTLALDDLCYHRPLYCLPSNTNLIVFCVIPWVPCYPTFVFIYLGVLSSFMSRMLWGLLHLLRNSWYCDTSHHHHSFLVPVLFIAGMPTNELCCVNSKLLATLSLVSCEW